MWRTAAEIVFDDEQGRSVEDGESVSWFPRSFVDLPDAPAQVLRFRDGSLPAPTPLRERSVVFVSTVPEPAWQTTTRAVRSTSTWSTLVAGRPRPGQRPW